MSQSSSQKQFAQIEAHRANLPYVHFVKYDSRGDTTPPAAFTEFARIPHVRAGYSELRFKTEADRQAFLNLIEEEHPVVRLVDLG